MKLAKDAKTLSKFIFISVMVIFWITIAILWWNKSKDVSISIIQFNLGITLGFLIGIM